MSHKSVLQVSYESVTQEIYKSYKQESHKRYTQERPPRASRKSVFYQSVPQEWPTRVSHKSVSHKVVSYKTVPHASIYRCLFVCAFPKTGPPVRLSTIDARLVNEHTRFPLLGATAGLAGPGDQGRDGHGTKKEKPCSMHKELSWKDSTIHNVNHCTSIQYYHDEHRV